MKHILATSGILAALLTSACSGDSEHVAKLRAALAEAELSLSDSVAVAELETSQGIGLKAALLVDAVPVFSVGALASDAFHQVAVDPVSGKVLSAQTAAQDAELCSDAVSLSEAIAAAEAEVGGEAVAIEPDDDGYCNREVKVLTSDALWEVKVGPAGNLVEPPEEADDEEGEDD